MKIIQNKILLQIILIFIFPFLLLYYIDYSSFYGTELKIFQYRNLKDIITNYIILFFITNLILFFTKRFNYYFIYFLFCFFLFTFLVFSNNLKIFYWLTPITTNDLLLLKEAFLVTKEISFLSEISLLKLKYNFLIIGIILIIFFFLFKKEIFAKATRILTMILLLFSFFYIIFFVQFSISFSSIYDYYKKGLVYYIINEFYSYYQTRKSPENYSKEKIENLEKKLLSKYQFSENHINSNNNYNIIIILGESFIDPQYLTALKLNRDVIPNFRKLTKKGISGKVQVSVFGGGTPVSEFEILTGFNTKLNDLKGIPQLEFLYDYFPSIVYDYNKSHITSIIRNDFSWFYSGIRAYKYLGFQYHFPVETFLNQFKYVLGKASDENIFNMAKFQLGLTKNLDLIYLQTTETHHPYNYQDIYLSLFFQSNKLDTNLQEIKIIEPQLDKNEKTTLLNYLYLLSDFDKKLYDFINELTYKKEKTIVVFFGDHYPPLGEELYKKLTNNYKNFNQYQTPYLIYANFPIDTSKIIHKNFNLNYLMSVVYQTINRKDNFFMNYLYDLYKEKPLIDKNDPFFSDLKLIQYDILLGKKYFKSLIQRTENRKKYHIGYTPEILNINLVSIDNDFNLIELTGKYFSLNTIIFYKDTPLKTYYINNHKILTLTTLKNIDTNSISCKLLLGIVNQECNKNNTLIHNNYNNKWISLPLINFIEEIQNVFENDRILIQQIKLKNIHEPFFIYNKDTKKMILKLNQHEIYSQSNWLKLFKEDHYYLLTYQNTILIIFNKNIEKYNLKKYQILYNKF